MIDYIRELFTKPQIELSEFDKLVMAIFILTIFIFVFTIVVSIYYLVKHIKEKIKERKRNKYKESLNDRTGKED